MSRLTKRTNDALVTTAVLTQAAIVSVMDKKGHKAFKELIEELGGKAPPDRSGGPEKPGKRRAQPAAPPVKGKRDARIPKPVAKRTKDDKTK